MARQLLVFATLALCPLAAAAEQRATYKECYARFDGARLTIGNRRIERQWRTDGRQLVATSYRDLLTDTEWLVHTPTPDSLKPAAFTFSAQTGTATPVESASLTVELKSVTSPAITHRFRIFPDTAGVLMERIAEDPGGDPLDQLQLAAEHVRVIQVTLVDQTDGHNELVFEKEWLLHPSERKLKLDGNLFVVENTLTSAGLVFLKLAPLPPSRPVPNPVDLETGMDGRTVRCSFLGPGYPYVVLTYSRGRIGRTEALQSFQRQLRRYVPERDGRFLSNTWGDRSRDLRINAGFMRSEIKAGAALGVDVIQIDDGWQTGRTANSARGQGVWSGYWSQDPHFWDVDRARFPGGLQPLVKEAASSGMKFGLWYGPDSSSDFANWRRDAERLLELHRIDGIDYFKIDSVKASSSIGEQNLRKMFDKVLRDSNGKVVFDLDVTAEVRPGYFGLPEVGPIFVENRYTDSHRYWPHQTLRNLWKLAQYVDPLRLRMEVLNQARNADKYTDDPLAPARYSPPLLFATVMMANPLGWFESSNLPECYERDMAPLVKVWKTHREAMFANTILPIGEAPDGANWSGFAAFSADRRSGYLLMFRGVNAPEEWRERLDVFGTGTSAAAVLAGRGRVAVVAGSLTVQIPDSPGFVWVRIEPAESVR